ncbi:MAG: nicotinate (nicotinamide) nucleotide adenylyltransferase [Oscillospiraceae bacterium]|nr:nicotinate (nicotinamide) nucleotide adenylyltransferase [Oscillospiraceae bacterium]
MRIGIFGGTFNPPHRGHLVATRAAIDALELDRLYVVPTGTPPHKPLPAGSPEPGDRHRLAQLLFAGEELVQVLDMEIKRPGPSYTVDTVKALKAQHLGADFFLLLGTDMFLSIEQWHRAEELIRLATPAVFAREQGQGGEIAAYMGRIKDLYGIEPARIYHDILALSSTEIRDTLAARQGVELTGETVYRELIRRGYYGAQVKFSWLREQAYSMLLPSRVIHVQGTETEAVQLARRWNADVDQAREAAILHDITKGFDLAEQLRLCQKYDMIPDDMEKKCRKLLHAKTGAAIARYEFGVCDTVFSAIACHTTGRPDMSLADKILYLADYIEPGRKFAEVSKLREMAYTALDTAVEYGLQLSLEELRARGLPPHPRTRAAIDWYGR